MASFSDGEHYQLSVQISELKEQNAQIIDLLNQIIDNQNNKKKSK